MKRKQKRYSSEHEIIIKIDKAKSEMAKIRTRIATNKKLTEEQLLALDVKVRRIENSTLPNLKNMLAAFRTKLLPGITDDPAVVLVR